MNWQIRVSFKGGTQSSNSSYESIYWSIDSGSSGSFFVAQMFVCQVHWKANAVEHDGGGKNYILWKIFSNLDEEEEGGEEGLISKVVD